MKKIVYVIEKFPSATEYFILNEILELERMGLEPLILVLKKQKQFLEIIRLKKLPAQVLYLPALYRYLPFLVFFLSPLATLKTMLRLIFIDNKELSLKKIRDYFISLYFLFKLKKNQEVHFHAHFAFMAVDIAEILSRIFNTRFSLTVHAQDIYTNQSKLKNIIDHCDFLITCTQYNSDYLNRLTNYKNVDKIYKVYHGIEIESWNRTNDVVTNSFQIRISCVARLEEKKGIIYLMEAVKELINEDYNIHCTIIGDGSLKKEMVTYIEKNNLETYIHLLGFQPHEKIKQVLSGSYVFILPCIIAKNGDRDGLPNTILEAMALGIPVISTKTSAIPEIIEDKITGIFVKSKDSKSIVNAVKELVNNKQLYNDIKANAKMKVTSELEIQNCTGNLIKIFYNHL